MKRALNTGVVLWVLVIVMVFVAARAGLRINTSPSVPRGLYWLSSGPVVVGGYVAVCPPPWSVFEQARAHGYVSHGPCAGGYSQMIKVLAARSGDAVQIDSDGVRIDGRLWPTSAPLQRDSSGWALPKLAGLQTTLTEHAVLVMSQENALGFDGRYFGPLPSTAITATAVPLFTW